MPYRRLVQRPGDDPNQLLIDWTPPPSEVDRRKAVPIEPLVQRLAWDFKTTFPLPTDEALDAGVIDETDLEADNLRSLHEQHAREALAVLRALDQVMYARRRGVDPRTGKPPRMASREKLLRYFETEPARLERSFQTLMDVYENGFGGEAADAFAKAVRAWHAGVEVMAEHRPPPQKGRRVSARLPVPRPLPTRVASGVFGLNQHGDPVRPSNDEVRAITERHAERIAALLASVADVGRSLKSPATDKGRLYAERDRVLGQVRSLVAAYAEDFGQQAARQLEAHARRQAEGSAPQRRQGLCHAPGVLPLVQDRRDQRVGDGGGAAAEAGGKKNALRQPARLQKGAGKPDEAEPAGEVRKPRAWSIDP